MKYASNEALSKPLSDLDRAKAMSRALTRAREIAPPAAATQSYTRLAKSTHAVSTPPADPAVVLPPLAAGTRWPDIVSWAQRATEAHAAFAVDAKGLLVSAIGMEDDLSLIHI